MKHNINTEEAQKHIERTPNTIHNTNNEQEGYGCFTQLIFGIIIVIFLCVAAKSCKGFLNGKETKYEEYY